MIELVVVGHAYDGDRWLFRGVSHRVADGELVAVAGPSGSGKTTLLALLGGLLAPREGEVVGAGTSVGWVFQSASGVARRTVLDHVAFPLLARGRRRAEAERGARELVARVGLAHRLEARQATLSGGESHRLALAQAMATGAAHLLLDEPTAALDRGTAAGVARLLRELAADGLAVVATTHDPLVIDAADAVVDLGRGAPGPGAS